MELGVSNPVATLQAPMVSHHSQQTFWGCAQANEEQVRGLKRLAVASANGLQLDDPAGAAPGCANVLRGLFGPQPPGDVAAMAVT